eukprot:g50005.t1
MQRVDEVGVVESTPLALNRCVLTTEAHALSRRLLCAWGGMAQRDPAHFAMRPTLSCAALDFSTRKLAFEIGSETGKSGWCRRRLTLTAAQATDGHMARIPLFNIKLTAPTRNINFRHRSSPTCELN